jgi:VWFA-related protein
MMNRCRAALVALLALGLPLAATTELGAQAPPAPEPADEQAVPVFGVESAVVLLDVVVRDKKGRLVKDLQASDFEVYENGERQVITDFQVIDRGPLHFSPSPPREAAAATPGSPATDPGPADAPGEAESPPDTQPAVIAFIFDRMSPRGRDMAHKAARAYTTQGHVEGDVVGVFILDQTLHTLEPFTTDILKVEEAFERAASQGQTSFASTRDTARQRQAEIERADAVLAQVGASGNVSSAGQAAAASVAAERTFDAIRMRMLQSFDRLERDQQGFASTNGLMAVVNGLKALPGRKTIVFFSEGLTISSNVIDQFRSVIATANRANVTVYAVDAGGLRIESGTEEARLELMATAQRRVRQEATGFSDLSDGAMTQGMERAEDMLRLNPQTMIGQLAEETGGFLVADTNDATDGFKRIQEEMRFYYLLSYSPTDSRFDGRFRTVSVKTPRSGVELYTRKGYLAVPPDTTVPVRTHEGPAIAQLDRRPPPDDFAVHASALSFPQPQRPGRVPVMVELSGEALTYTLNEDTKEYEADFTIVARLRNDEGHEVDRLSRRYPLTVPQDSLEKVKRGKILFFQETDLPTGHYTLEAAVHDALGDRASVRRDTVDVPAPVEGQVRLSSLVLLQRVEKLSASEVGADNPLHYGETIVYPNLGEQYHKSVMPALGFYFTAWSDTGAEAPGRATVELIRDEQVIAKLPIPLPAPDASGRIQHAATLPLQNLPPGDYTLRLVVESGPAFQARQARFALAE